MTRPAAELDAADPLAQHRDLFVGTDTPLVYLDGNSLGRPLKATGDRLRTFVNEEWAGRLIRGWDERWMDLPEVLGDAIGAQCLGASTGQTIVGDSTTVLLYKLMRAAVALQASDQGRTEIVMDNDNFPTDRFVAEGIAAERGLSLRWIEVDPESGVTAEQLSAVVGEQTALVALSHVAYRSAWIADGAELTRIAHEAGALMLWDLSHSVGSVLVELEAWDADFAVGCTYKYLNGGPGAPAFAYVAERLLDDVVQPIQGWLGAADPFLMGPTYRPADGVRRILSGTPPVIGMLALQDMLQLVSKVGMTAIREKSIGLTAYAVERAATLLPDVALASPADPARRGGHVTFTHPLMREATDVLWARDVIPDYRDPGGLRLGLSPLSTSYDEVERGLLAVRDVLDSLAARG